MHLEDLIPNTPGPSDKSLVSFPASYSPKPLTYHPTQLMTTQISPAGSSYAASVACVKSRGALTKLIKPDPLSTENQTYVAVPTQRRLNDMTSFPR